MQTIWGRFYFLMLKKIETSRFFWGWSRVIRNPQPARVPARHDRRSAQDLRSLRLWRHGCLVLAVGLLPLAAAEASNGTAKLDEKLDEKVAYKEVTGTVTYVGKRAMNVEYAVTKEGSYEMMLPYDASVRVARVRSLADFKQGDTVRVKYRQTYRHGDKGEKIVLDTVATEIALVRSAPSASTFRSDDTTVE